MATGHRPLSAAPVPGPHPGGKQTDKGCFVIDLFSRNEEGDEIFRVFCERSAVCVYACVCVCVYVCVTLPGTEPSVRFLRFVVPQLISGSILCIFLMWSSVHGGVGVWKWKESGGMLLVSGISLFGEQ